VTEIKTISFKSEPRQTFFAPEWDYSFYEFFLKDIDLTYVAKIILEKENKIKNHFDKNFVLRNKKKQSVDGYTGLGENSLTARYPFFNVFSWEEDEIQKIKNQLLQFYLEILKINNAPRINTWMQCWANVMRENEKMQPHIHSVTPTCYLGGHITIQTFDSYTGYICPINQINDPFIYKSKNIPGKVTIFPNNIPHYTSEYKSKNEERITIAFDIDVSQISQNHIPFDFQNK
jgi:hypothetical protein